MAKLPTIHFDELGRSFPKHEKSVIFGILAKGGPHENFSESSSFGIGSK